jgi:hypothetical protein
MVILKKLKESDDKKSYHFCVRLGEVSFSIEASSKEEAIELANDRTWNLVNTGDQAFMCPKILRIDGEPYEAPHTIVRNHEAFPREQRQYYR